MRNILDAELGPVSLDGVVEARLADGTVLRARDGYGTGGEGAGAVGFRASSVSLEPARAGATDARTGVVARSLFVGDTVQVWVRSGSPRSAPRSGRGRNSPRAAR